VLRRGEIEEVGEMGIERGLCSDDIRGLFSFEVRIIYYVRMDEQRFDCRFQASA
jgi:hypothetical protein